MSEAGVLEFIICDGDEYNAMYLRKTNTKTLGEGGAYYTYRIVESVRLGKQVK